MYGSEVKSLPSFQGFQGVVNTPNAEVVLEGEFGLLFTNQVDTLSKTSSLVDFRNNREEESYILSMGVLPHLDMSFRYTYAYYVLTDSQYLSDRSLSFKYQLPYISNDSFKVALGIQDMGNSKQSNNFGSSYIVTSYEIEKVRASLGYASATTEGAFDGLFANIEYQPYSWLQLAGEYDGDEWNAALKSEYGFTLDHQTINLGLMAKSSLDYNNVYFGVYAHFPFYDMALPLAKTTKKLPTFTSSFNALGLNNVVMLSKNDTLYFEYENGLCSWNNIDSLAKVLGYLVVNYSNKDIVVTVKKANLAQYSVKINREAYQKYLESGIATPNLMTFDYTPASHNMPIEYSNRFKPLISIEPDFILIDGSEYGHMDYSVALNLGLSMRIGEGAILSGRYYLPLAMSENFKENGIFDYRIRNKTEGTIDQALLSQYFHTNTLLPWTNLFQVGIFDNELQGVSWESAMSDKSGKHLFMLKFSYLDDKIYEQIDRYDDTNIRAEKLFSYRYYLEEYNANVKLTAGEFLYGDTGVSLSLERYYSDIIVRFDIAQTDHTLRGENTIAKLALSIPFGPKKRYKTDYLDIEGGDLTYIRRKTVLNNDGNAYAQPHHLKEIDNSFTIENYFLDKGRSNPSYIKANQNRLRNMFLDDVE